MTVSIFLVLTSAAVFCLLFTTTIILLALAAVYFCLSVEPPERNEPPVVQPVIKATARHASASIIGPSTTAVAVVVPLRGKHRPPPMPTISEETIYEVLWACHEVPTRRQELKHSPAVFTTASTTDPSYHDAYMIMSGEPPAMPVILEESEEDLRRENFSVLSRRKDGPPPPIPAVSRTGTSTIITDEEQDTEPEIAMWAPLEFPPSSHQQQVQHTVVVVPVASTSTSTSNSSADVMEIIGGVYKGSSCTVVRCTAKMVEVQILGDSKTRRIMKTSLLWA